MKSIIGFRTVGLSAITIICLTAMVMSGAVKWDEAKPLIEIALGLGGGRGILGAAQSMFKKGA